MEWKDSLNNRPPQIQVYIERLSHGKGLPYPSYMTDHAVGMDVYAAVDEDVKVAPGDIFLCPTGFKVAIPESFELQVRPRSGLAIRHGLTVVNAPGTIDPDYRGEVKVGLINLGKVEFIIKRSMRVAQMVLAPRFRVVWVEAEALDSTERGKGGFGHTGL